jgi:hypothetical protein
MENLSLEIFNLVGTGSQFAALDENTSITITDTSEIFASGDVWSWDFRLDTNANLHIFGTSGDLHGSRLYEQINKRRARLWVMGLPLFLGYLKLGDNAEVDTDGYVSVSFSSGQKTFEENIEGISAREVSVGDVEIGVALNRKRIVQTINPSFQFTLDGLDGYSTRDRRIKTVATTKYTVNTSEPDPRGSLYDYKYTPYAQRWPKLVKSHGKVWNSSGEEEVIDKTNTHTPYDGTPEHSFCNINICYQMKVNDNGEEKSVRGYTMRLGHGEPTTHGGDNQTRYNNAPNFYLLYWIDRLFKDMGIQITENQAMDVEDLRRVFMLNYGCFYEEIEDFDSISHSTPSDKLSRYGQYYIPFVDHYIISSPGTIVKYISPSPAYNCMGMDLEKGTYKSAGKVLLRDVNVRINGTSVLQAGSIEGKVLDSWFRIQSGSNVRRGDFTPALFKDPQTPEDLYGGYSAYLAYATGENYPKVEIREIIDAMKSMFGVRFIFDNNYHTVRIVLLRNIFQDTDVQDIVCDIMDNDEKVENGIRGFRLTYGKGSENTSFYYKGFNDMFKRAAAIWKDSTDKHDYSQWKLDAEYDEIKQGVSAMNKICYVTPVNGNAYMVKVDEDENVLFPMLTEYAAFIDSEDGDCSGKEETINEIQMGASPVIMNDINGAHASLFSGELKAPVPVDINIIELTNVSTKIGTFARITNEQSLDFVGSGSGTDNGTPFTFAVSGKLDIYSCEGFQLRMEDNYSIGNGGTPFDEAEPGLQFGIMRSGGEDAYIHYYDDPDDDDNYAWEIEPGSGGITHPDSCDSYGNLWSYGGGVSVNDTRTAIEQMRRLWPDSNIDLVYSSGTTLRNIDTYIHNATYHTIDWKGNKVTLLFATTLGQNAQVDLFYKNGSHVNSTTYANKFKRYETVQEMFEFDANTAREGLGVLIEVAVDQSPEWVRERKHTLMDLQRRAFANNGMSSNPIIIDDNGVGSLYGRFSMKLRAEKPNPNFDPKQEETYYDPIHPELNTNPRYLHITNRNLQGRGIADQFYKEYSYWMRNARILKRTVRMELAQLLAIDKTKRVRVGNVTGFIRKLQYTISKDTGLGDVTIEIMYI